MSTTTPKVTEINDKLNKVGVTDGSVAQPGEVGEYIETVGSTVNSIGNNSNTNLQTLVLQPGSWDVTGFCIYDPTGDDSSTVTIMHVGISLTSTVITNSSDVKPSHFTSAVGYRMNAPAHRIDISTPTTVYLVTRLTDYTGTVPSNRRMLTPTIYARRVR